MTEFLDPERHKKRIELAISVSNKIKQFALKSRGSFHTETKEEKEQRIVVSFLPFERKYQLIWIPTTESCKRGKSKQKRIHRTK